MIVIFAEEVYFTRWYYLRELQLALAPYVQRLERSAADETSTAAALQHLVIALPAAGTPPQAMRHLPPFLQTANWPTADQPQELVAR